MGADKNGMSWENPICPECGGQITGTVEAILGLAGIEPDGKGGYQYAGETDVWWDDQYTEQDLEGNDRLRCDNGHDWYSKRIDPEDVRMADRAERMLKVKQFLDQCGLSDLPDVETSTLEELEAAAATLSQKGVT